jgi:hypothetical protein
VAVEDADCQVAAEQMEGGDPMVLFVFVGLCPSWISKDWKGQAIFLGPGDVISFAQEGDHHESLVCEVLIFVFRRTGG